MNGWTGGRKGRPYVAVNAPVVAARLPVVGAALAAARSYSPSNGLPANDTRNP